MTEMHTGEMFAGVESPTATTPQDVAHTQQVIRCTIDRLFIFFFIYLFMYLFIFFVC